MKRETEVLVGGMEFNHRTRDVHKGYGVRDETPD